MIINHNISALNTQRVLGLNKASADQGMERLSSGLRINHAADDAAGLAISEKMRSQVNGLNQASRNIQDGISFIQTTEGHLEETTSVLQRLRVLAVQSANGIHQQEDRDQIQVEVSQLIDEINRVSSQAQFNGITMLDGTFATDAAQNVNAPEGQQNVAAPGGGIIVHMGANADQSATVSVGDMSAVSLGVDTLTLASIEGANTGLGQLDNALQTVSKQRADLGAYQNRLTQARIGVDISAENLQASESRIRDADMAARIVDFTKDSVMSQAAIAMLAQANQRPQQVLRLLG